MQLEARLPIQLVVFHPDSSLVALCCKDPEKDASTISIWDWRRGEQVCPPIAHEKKVQSLAFSPVGRSILIGSSETAEVWGIDQGQARLETTISSPGFKARFSPTGEFILVTNHGRLLDAKTGEEIRRFPHVGSNLFFADFSPDESRVVTASPDRSARIWDLASGELLHSLPHDGQVLEARFSADGRLVATASPLGKARVWDGLTGRLLQEFDHGDEKVMQAAITADGRALVSVTWSGVYSWDLFSGIRIPHSYGPPTLRQVIHLSEDPDLVLISSPFRGASVWRLKNAQPKSQILRHPRATNMRPHGDVVWKAGFSPDGNQVISSGSDLAARLWNSYTSEQILPVFKWEIGWHAGFSPDQSEILVASQALNQIDVFDALTGDEILTEPIRSEGLPFFAAYSPKRNAEGDYLVVVAGIGSRAARLFNTRTGQPVGKPLIHHGAGSFNTNVLSDLRVMFGPNGEQEIVGTDDGTARLFAVPSGDLLLTLQGDEGHRYLLQSVRFDPVGGRRVVTASSDGTAIIWSVSGPDAGRVLHRLTHSQDIVSYAEFSPDGRKVVTASVYGSVRIWDAGTGELIGTPMVHGGTVRVAKFSSDSQRGVTASMDHTTRIWDASTGHALSDPLWHDGGTTWATFNKDGDRLVTAGIDSTARIWEHPALPDGEVPDWLAQWATAVSGLELGEDNVVRELDKAEREAIKEGIVAQADDGFYGKTVRWFYSDKKTRPITPFSRVSVSQWVEHRIRENTSESLASALAGSPNHPLALSQLAHVLANNASSEEDENLVRAWHLMERAVAGDPAVSEWVSPVESAGPRFAVSYLKLLAARLRTGEALAWQKICRRLLAQYEESSEPGDLERVVKIGSVAPLPADLARQVRKLARRGEGLERNLAWDAVAWGMAAYRAGEYEEADAHLTGAMERAATMEWVLGRDLCRTLALPVQAMALARLEKGGEAVGLLGLAEEELSQLKRKEVGDNWMDVIFADVLFEEAKLVVGQ
jgi:WD40 repeat protein